MIGFGLLVGHLLGDYVLQNDWMAKNKVNPHPGNEPKIPSPLLPEAETYPERLSEWCHRNADWQDGHLSCTAHCLLYTLAVWACSYWWMPWWGLLACFATHWPVDRFRLARWWMLNVSGQAAFATGALAPWSVIVVDNTFHLLTLFLIAAAAGQ